MNFREFRSPDTSFVLRHRIVFIGALNICQFLGHYGGDGAGIHSGREIPVYVRLSG